MDTSDKVVEKCSGMTRLDLMHADAANRATNLAEKKEFYKSAKDEDELSGCTFAPDTTPSKSTFGKLASVQEQEEPVSVQGVPNFDKHADRLRRGHEQRKKRLEEEIRGKPQPAPAAPPARPAGRPGSTAAGPDRAPT